MSRVVARYAVHSVVGRWRGTYMTSKMSYIVIVTTVSK